MGLFLTTVAGFLILLIVSIAMLIHYLRKGLDSSSSVKIDSKPTEKF